MDSRGPNVALVVDPSFGQKLVGLASRLPVWIAESNLNRVAAQLIWSAERTGANDSWISTFKVNRSDRPDAIAAAILETLVEHHCFLSRLEVYGAEVTPLLTTAFAKSGFTRFQRLPDGFLSWRASARGPT